MAINKKTATSKILIIMLLLQRCEEPVLTNMDISTGHMVLVRQN